MGLTLRHPGVVGAALVRAVLADTAGLRAGGRVGGWRWVHAAPGGAVGAVRRAEAARTVLDLADAGAARSCALAPSAGWQPSMARCTTAHLAAHSPAPAPYRASAGAGYGNEWWEQAIALTPRRVVAEADAEGASLVGLVFMSCPSEHAGHLETRVRTAVGAPPPAAVLEEAFPAGAGQADGLASRSPRGCGYGTGRRSCPPSCWLAGNRCRTRCAP